MAESIDKASHCMGTSSLAETIEADGLTTSDLFWIENSLPTMTKEMARLMVLLLLLDNTRLRKIPKKRKSVSGSPNS